MDPPAAAPGQREFRVGPEQAGARLDLFLAAGLGISRAEARRLLDAGCVQLDARSVDVRAKGRSLTEGSLVRIRAYVPPALRRPQADLALAGRVVAEGPGFLALDKPAGVPVHPYREEESGTLLSAVVALRPETFGVGEGGLRSGVVHRLDVDTSGVVLFGTEEGVWQRLRRAFRAGAVDKRYRAIVCGELAGGGELALHLVVAQHRPARVRTASAGERGARPVAMHWRALAVLRGATLVEVRPRTGFLHQIRAAFAATGHPLLGDSVYGPAAASTGTRRHLLHAASLRFEAIEARAPDPDDFREALRELSPGDPFGG